MRQFFFITIFALLLVSQVFAGESVQILSLKQWREQRLTEASNRLIRASNKITTIKATTGNLDEINKIESERRVAEQNIEFARALTVEDYFNFYLIQYADNDAALVKVAKAMKRAEMADLIKHLLRARTNSAANDGNSDIISVVTDKTHVDSRL